VLAPDKSTFAPAVRLLPRDIRDDVRKLYRILRTLDDIVDEHQPQAEERVRAVERWAQNQPAETPETRLLSDLARRHALPRQALREFCQGMRHDLDNSSITTEEELELYCQRAGGSVGIMLARLLRTTRNDSEEKMATLGRAMQRTNILRDIDEDAAHGHIYIAQNTIERYGPPTPGARADLLRDQIARADSLYEQAAQAPSGLARGQKAMALSAALYREILRQIERRDDEHTQRATVPAWRRRLLIVKHHLI
jgi:15-cis-phytoene synthase